MEVLLALAVPLALGFGVALATATSARRAGALIAVGVGLGLLWILIAYLSSPTSRAESNCSDCGNYGGRIWQPVLAVGLAGAGALLWSVGVAAGTAARRARDARTVRTP